MNVETGREPQSIHIEYDLPQPPATVWRALTDSKIVAAWLMANDLRPEVGHRFTFQAQPMPGWDGVVHCEVLEVEAEKRLVYSWRGGAGALTLDTRVTWTLTPAPSGGTRLSLEHTGFSAGQTMAFEALRKGWAGKVNDRMRDVLSRLA